MVTLFYFIVLEGVTIHSMGVISISKCWLLLVSENLRARNFVYDDYRFRIYDAILGRME